MKYAIFIFCIIFCYLESSDEWIKENIYKKQEEAAKRADNEEWFKNVLKERLSEVDQFDVEEIKSRTQEILSKSKPCGPVSTPNDDFNFYILMTFELPDSLWLEYSLDLERIKGAFVVRGLPQDSFVEFAKKVRDLRKIGVHAPIQINPMLFDQYEVFNAPTIILEEGKLYDKISGPVSVHYALEKFSNEGDVDKEKKYLRNT